MSLTVLTIALVVSAGVFYCAFVLYGAWIDGRRQAVREQGLRPVTEPTGAVHGEARDEAQNEAQNEARIGEEESGNGSKRT